MTDRAIVEAVKKEYNEALFAALGPLPGGRDPQRPLPGPVARGAPAGDAPVGGDERDLLPEGQPQRRLSLRRVPGRASSREQSPGTSCLHRDARLALAALGLDLDEFVGLGGGAGSRATAGSVASPPATSTRSRRGRSPL